eukprot:NODE_44_length_3915_cov_37.600362_g38_i0.p1 GENE.NODE_44_length_3915_cov_37.600362_g38_i0~~NODE_44_length_3915_cov_37.600362_g38_i0.p1  ORF type:complete len:376 (-),score=-18.89 NODE_44_length_3915_cov_37.600362_g38_i0:2616-3743(-)
MSTINIAPSWELLKKSDRDTSKLDWRDTQQCMDFFGLSNWGVSTELVDKVITKSLVTGTDQIVEQSWQIPKGQNNDKVIVVRKDTGQGLAFRTAQYTPVQNETLFEFGDVLMKQFNDAKWVHMGKLGDGHKVYGVMILPNSGFMFGTDIVDNYLTIANGHDGSMGVTAMVTPIRLSCTNQLSFALKNASHSLRTKHTLRVDDRIALAKESIEQFHVYNEQMKLIGDNLFELPCSTEDIRKMYVGLNGVDASKEDVTEVYNGKGRPESKLGEDGRPIKYGSMQSNKFDNAEELLVSIYDNRFDGFEEVRRTDANTMQGIENTMWGGLNALTEHLDWYQGKYSDSSKIVERQMFNSGHQKKRDAILDMVLDYNEIKV